VSQPALASITRSLYDTPGFRLCDTSVMRHFWCNTTETEPMRRIPSSGQSTVLHVRVHEEERRKIENAAKKAGKSLSEHIRDRLLNATSNLPPIASSPLYIAKHDMLGIEAETADLRDKKSEEKNPAGQPSNLDLLVSGRIGHQTGCCCFACSRLRELLGSDRKWQRG
jgi:hypothetical protein